MSVGTSTGGGSYSYSAGSLTITGSGADFWGPNTNAGYFVGKLVPNANFDVSALITSEGTSNVWAKAGIMARMDLSGSNNPAVINAQTPGNGLVFQHSFDTQLSWGNGNGVAGRRPRAPPGLSTG